MLPRASDSDDRGKSQPSQQPLPFNPQVIIKKISESIHTLDPFTGNFTTEHRE